MKKILVLCITFLLVLSGCSSKSTTSTNGVKQVTGNGYGGEIVLDVTLNGETIEDITVVSHHETAPVFDRAFPVLKERILSEQTPVVDSVSGATISSYAIKSAVAAALKENGKDVGDISGSTSSETAELEQLENIQTQIVVVGGGPAGLAAGIAAIESGATDVTIIEKLDILSGNGKFDMNFFDLYRSQAKELAGTNMSKEEFLESKASSTDSKERLEAWTETAYDLDAWLREMGISLDYTYSANSHMANESEYAGDHIQTQLEKRAIEAGVTILTGTKGTDLVLDGDKVVGVSVETKKGTYDINADAVILATGGFSHNKELLAQYAPGKEVYVTSNQMGATGDFVPVFEKNGYQLANMEVLSEFSNILDPRRDLTGGADVAFRVDETGKEAAVNENSAFYITDKEGYDSFYRIRKHVEAGYYQTTESLDEMAEAFGIDAAGLKASIEEYNKNVTDKAEGFESKRLFSLEGPYYGAKVKRAIHMTKGGVVANEKAEVLDVNNNIVEGLYAAGEVTATSGAYSAAVVFGKISGIEAAKYIQNK